MYCNVKLFYMNVLLGFFVPMFCMYFNISVGLDLEFNLNTESWEIQQI